MTVSDIYILYLAELLLILLLALTDRDPSAGDQVAWQLKFDSGLVFDLFRILSYRKQN